MYKLYGFPVSNYFNMVKLALLEKGLEFEEVFTRPSQEADYLEKSPMGKVPCLETSDGPLCETNVILDFLEETVPRPAFYPLDPYQKAKTRELMKATELYVELVARLLLAGVFFGETLSDELKNDVRAKLEKGTAALNKLLRFAPYASGAEMTNADFMLYYTVALGNMLTQQALGINLEDEIPGLADWIKLMDGRDTVQKINADRDEALKAMAG
jgi:glutathione S-transferase